MRSVLLTLQLVVFDGSAESMPQLGQTCVVYDEFCALQGVAHLKEVGNEFFWHCCCNHGEDRLSIGQIWGYLDSPAIRAALEAHSKARSET